MILAYETEVWASQSGHLPQIDEEIDEAFVENVRTNDYRVDVCLRPPGYSRVLLAQSTILDWMERERKNLPVGKDSKPEEIKQLFPQMSKSVFKAAVGALLREGAIEAKPKA